MWRRGKPRTANAGTLKHEIVANAIVLANDKTVLALAMSIIEPAKVVKSALGMRVPHQIGRIFHAVVVQGVQRVVLLSARAKYFGNDFTRGILSHALAGNLLRHSHGFTTSLAKVADKYLAR